MRLTGPNLSSSGLSATAAMKIWERGFSCATGISEGSVAATRTGRAATRLNNSSLSLMPARGTSFTFACGSKALLVGARVYRRLGGV